MDHLNVLNREFLHFVSLCGNQALTSCDFIKRGEHISGTKDQRSNLIFFQISNQVYTASLKLVELTRHSVRSDNNYITPRLCE